MIDKLLVEAGAYFGGDGINYERFEPRKFADLVRASTPPQRTEQEPVAWRTFDGEGQYEYRAYEENESYADDWNKRNPNHAGWVDKLYTHSQPEQEPMALPPVQFEKVAEGIEVGYDILGGVDIRLGGEFVYVHINYDYRYTHNAARKALAKQIVGLLTTPPKRTWIGLTDVEIDYLLGSTVGENEETHISFARAIESKLKEVNT
jgi:hypothetical protein